MSLKKSRRNLEDDLILTIDDLSIGMKYVPEKNQKFNGQLKLLLTTMNFLIDNVKNNDVILYIGSGKGYNIPILIKLFEDYNLEWHLYDPVGHCYSLENNGSIFVNNKFFTVEEARKFKNNEMNKKLIFISDIRTAKGDSVRTTDLIKNYEFQNEVIDLLNPRVSMLKWRCPFPDDWVKDFKIPTGKEYIQAYAAKFSNELRLVAKSPYIYKSVTNDNAENYEGLLYYYNKVLRKKNNTKIVEYIFSKIPLSLKKKIKIHNLSTSGSIKSLIKQIQDEKNAPLPSAS